MGEYGVLAEYLPFALPGVQKRRLFEDIFARSSCALDRQECQWAADGPRPNPSSAGGGIMPFSCVVMSDRTCELYEILRKSEAYFKRCQNC